MKVIIDRFEDSYAMVEMPDHSLAVIPRQILDPEAKPGDVIEIRIDISATKARHQNPLDFLDNAR